MVPGDTTSPTVVTEASPNRVQPFEAIDDSKGKMDPGVESAARTAWRRSKKTHLLKKKKEEVRTSKTKRASYSLVNGTGYGRLGSLRFPAASPYLQRSSKRTEKTHALSDKQQKRRPGH